jgi:hypothetical protein
MSEPLDGDISGILMKFFTTACAPCDASQLKLFTNALHCLQLFFKVTARRK